MPDCKKKCFLHKFLSKIIGLQAGENKIGVFSRENAVSSSHMAGYISVLHEEQPVNRIDIENRLDIYAKGEKLSSNKTFYY